MASTVTESVILLCSVCFRGSSFQLCLIYWRWFMCRLHWHVLGRHGHDRGLQSCPRNRVGLLDKTPCNEYEKEDTRRNFPHETIRNIKEQYQKCTKEDIAEYSKHSLPQADRNSTQSGCIMLHPQIIAGKSAFVALNKNAGTITCWGLPSQGGNSAGCPWWGCLFA